MSRELKKSILLLMSANISGLNKTNLKYINALDSVAWLTNLKVILMVQMVFKITLQLSNLQAIAN